MKLSSSERVTAQEYVDELMRATQEIYGVVQRAQERRAEETKERAGKGRNPTPLEVGQLVLLRRPPAIARDEQGQEAKIRKIAVKMAQHLTQSLNQHTNNLKVVGKSVVSCNNCFLLAAQQCTLGVSIIFCCCCD